MSIIDDIYTICKNYSMISKERFACNINAVIEIESKQIEGCIIEIGVWKGGSILSMILTSELFSKTPREFHLYDTFEGMTVASDVDKDLNNNSAESLMNQNAWVRCISGLDEVKSNIQRHTNITPYYHVGDIRQNNVVPEKIAILRLDTDWYDSTKYELETFYNNVSPGGIIIIDDYGHWQGCKKAVDEFLEKHPTIVLQTIDYTGRYFYKPS
jgi:O-methyltransferase